MASSLSIDHSLSILPRPQLPVMIAAWLPDAALRERVLVANPAKLYRFADGELLAAS